MEHNKLVYIASPYSGDVERNVAFAKAACRYAMNQGVTPIASHLLYPQMLDDGVPEERKLGTDMGLRILKVCEEVWVCGSELSSGRNAEQFREWAAGMEQEIRAARQLQIPLRRVSEQEIGWELCEAPIQKGMEMGG